MESNVPAELAQLKTDLLQGMREYMIDVASEGDDADYSESEIASCESILDGFLAKVTTADKGNTEQVMSAVKEAVLALNKLNAQCDDSLIETDQREQICELIIKAAAAAGVGSGEDITEDWREW